VRGGVLLERRITRLLDNKVIGVIGFADFSIPTGGSECQ